jgi:hypothetical protein
MLRVTLRGQGVPTAVLGSGETVLFGRSPHAALPDTTADELLRYAALTLPNCAQHVSRVLGELAVGEEMVRAITCETLAERASPLVGRGRGLPMPADDGQRLLGLGDVLVARTVDVTSTQCAAHPELRTAGADEIAQPAFAVVAIRPGSSSRRPRGVGCPRRCGFGLRTRRGDGS